MALSKYSKKSDKIANLYRAAFYLAKGSKDIAIDFIKKSGESFDNLESKTKAQRLFWAEKILDKYNKLRYS